MAITPNQPAAISRYFGVGVTEVLFVNTISSQSAPTFAELDGGTEITRDIAEVSGFTVSSNFIETPDLKTRFVSKVPGRITADDSSLTFYADEDRGAGDMAEILPRDTEGYLVFADAGLASGVGDVFHVKVGSNTTVRSTDDTVKRMVTFAIVEEPSEGVTLPQS